MTFQKGTSGNPRGRPRRDARDAAGGEAAAVPGDLANLTTEQKAQAVEATLWRWLRDARRDRDRSGLARELVAVVRVIGELRRELKAHGDVNVLVLQQRVQERETELARQAQLHDAEAACVVGFVAANWGLGKRRELLAALARVRAGLEHKGPGYPQLPAPAGEEAVPPVPGVAGQAPEAPDVPLPTEKGEPAAAAPAEPASPPPVDGQGRPLPPGWTVGPQGQRLPPGVTMEPGTPRPRGAGGVGRPYGDEPPWSGD